MSIARLALAGVLIGGLVPAASAQQSVSRPNIVVLVADDVRWDALGAAGNPTVLTPRLDELARDGVRFTHAYVTTSICWVSRASMLTGQYMSRHGLTTAAQPLSAAAFAETYPAVLRRTGYWTGFVGKWHNAEIRQADFDFARAYFGRHWIDDPEVGRIHVTEKNARDALTFLRTRPHDRPFMLNVAFFAAHAEDAAKEQYLPQPWSAAAYDGVRIPPPILASPDYLAALPPFIRDEANEGRVRYHWRFDTLDSYQRYMTNYFRLITELDDAVGRLVDELKAQGVYENTVILFIGDNGYFQADRGLADKWYAYEESIRVPLIIRDPRLRVGGITRDETALNIDLAPTVLGAAGVPAPAAMQGKDLAPLYAASQPVAWRDEFFYEHPTVTSRNRIPASVAVVRRDAKYVLYPEWNYDQLFDLNQDPTELHNVVSDTAHQDMLRDLRAKLDAWRQRAR